MPAECEEPTMGEPKFVPKTVYVIYITSTPEKVWDALTSAEFTRQYFFGPTPRSNRESAAASSCACRMVGSTPKDA
jgi:uncharacterized protein YndB with AHSA1/START domain